MTIYIDADSCPKKIRDIVANACIREEISAVFVANRKISVKNGGKISFFIVENKENSADLFIERNVKAGDMVITRDIPLAASLVEKGIVVLNDRGTVYSEMNVKERLSERNFMKELREFGISDKKERIFGIKEIRAFSNVFDRELQLILKKGKIYR